MDVKKKTKSVMSKNKDRVLFKMSLNNVKGFRMLKVRQSKNKFVRYVMHWAKFYQDQSRLFKIVEGKDHKYPFHPIPKRRLLNQK